MTPAPVLASLVDTVETFLDGADDFFSHLASINWLALILALAFFGMYLLLRSRALFNALRYMPGIGVDLSHFILNNRL